MRPEPKFKLGARVKIIDNGELYTTYTSFFEENDIGSLNVNYAYGVGMRIIKKDYVARVLRCGYTKGCDPRIVYVIQLDNESANDCGIHESAVYLIEEKGLEELKLQMTRAEAEAKYDIEIID